MIILKVLKEGSLKNKEFKAEKFFRKEFANKQMTEKQIFITKKSVVSQRSQEGSALIVGLIIVVLLTIMTVSFLEKVLGLGRVSGGISNSAQAYALTTGLIEEQLMDSAMTKQTPWNIQTKTEWNNTLAGNSTGRTLTVYTGWSTLPMIGKWNSQYDTDWNIIGQGQPVQIVIPNGVNWGSVNFYFRVPSIPGETSSTGSSSASGIILWTFGYSGASLYASGETNIFKLNHIDGSSKTIDAKNWLTNTGVSIRFDAFYNNYWSNCGTNFQCTLKLSMIRPFVTTWGKSYPFLEYKIDFSNVSPAIRIPSQYMILDSSAFIRGYLRSRQVRIPQITTNTATDFAVLQ
jgi:hypothetical protein